jgi:hypothetical protein
VRPSKATECRETWFAGVHSDVGGGFRDDPELSRITLKWMTDRALDHDLLLRPGAYQKVCAVKQEDGAGRIHRNGWFWGILTWRRRPLSPAEAPLVHASVRARIEADPAYELPLGPGEVVWEDPDWTTPHPKAPARAPRVPETDPVEAAEPA